jgi:protein-disulfide isomerase
MIKWTEFMTKQWLSKVLTERGDQAWRPVCLLSLVLISSSFAAAQDATDLRKDIAELKEVQKAMQKDLEEIKELLKNTPHPAAAGAPAMPKTSLVATGILVKGDAKAPVTIVEYTDMQCPFCSRHSQTVFTQIDNEYIKSGKVRYVVKDFPLESMHQNAFQAAQANHCAAEQNRAWDMHDRLFANQQKLAKEDLIGYADAIGLDSAKFKACLEIGKYAPVIRKEISEAQSSGVTATPTFFLGAADSKSYQMKPEKTITGAVDFSAFKTAIDELLTKKE